ncbi:3-oxo-5-alpha-steroid 4-dehydrogenase [Holotrichia oblita]|nr:3-oxo-5-alpha-steroid 4-dehydrogenase [Holotrichia oblita]
MKGKTRSLAIIVIIYFAALGAAVSTAASMNKIIENRILLIFLADCAATFFVFIFGLIFKNSSVYDPYWSVAPIFIAAGFYVSTGTYPQAAHFFVLIPLSFWAVRLTYNWAKGFSDLTWQDWRYVGFKNKYPRIYPLISLLGIMLMPTVLVFTGMIPFYFLITGSVNNVFSFLGGLLITSAAMLQAVSDFQMHKFRNDPDNKGKCIDSGLWRYSRHPNYFGEILIWWGVLLASMPNFNRLAVVGAPLITCLFIFISIPMMEKHIIKNRPDYSEYRKKVVSPIIPFLRKAGTEEINESNP